MIRGGVVEIHSGLARISLVGIGLATHTKTAAIVSEILIENQIEYGFVSNTDISLSMTVDSKEKQRAIEILAKRFGL